MRIFSDAGGWYLRQPVRRRAPPLAPAGRQTDQPRASYDGVSGAAEISSRYLEDGSYWRLQDLTLGYRLPERLGRGAGLRLGPVLRLGAQPVHHHRTTRGYSPDVNSNGASNNASGIATSARSPASVWAPTSTPIRWPAPSPSASRPPGSRHHARELRDDYPFRLRLRAGGVAGGLQLDPRPGPGRPVAGQPTPSPTPTARAPRWPAPTTRSKTTELLRRGLRRSSATCRPTTLINTGTSQVLRRRRRQPVPGRQRHRQGHLERRSTTASTGPTSFWSGCPPLDRPRRHREERDPGRGALPARAPLPQPGQALRRRAHPAHAGQGRERGRRAPSGARRPTCIPRSWPTWARPGP